MIFTSVNIKDPEHLEKLLKRLTRVGYVEFRYFSMDLNRERVKSVVVYDDGTYTLRSDAVDNSIKPKDVMDSLAVREFMRLHHV